MCIVLAGNTCNRVTFFFFKKPRILSSLLLSLVDQDMLLLLLAVYGDPTEKFWQCAAGSRNNEWPSPVTVFNFWLTQLYTQLKFSLWIGNCDLLMCIPVGSFKPQTIEPNTKYTHPRQHGTSVSNNSDAWLSDVHFPVCFKDFSYVWEALFSRENPWFSSWNINGVQLSCISLQISWRILGTLNTYISTVPGIGSSNRWLFFCDQLVCRSVVYSTMREYKDCSAGRRRRRVLICVLFVTMNFVLILFLWNEGAVGLYVPWCYQSEASIRVLFVTMHFVLILFLWNEAAVGLYVPWCYQSEASVKWQNLRAGCALVYHHASNMQQQQ